MNMKNLQLQLVLTISGITIEPYVSGMTHKNTNQDAVSIFCVGLHLPKDAVGHMHSTTGWSDATYHRRLYHISTAVCQACYG